MKLKLAGLLVFSQAAMAASSIDKNNYMQNLCDDDLFKPLPKVFEGPFDNSVIAQIGRENIKRDYINYCYFRGKYEEAEAERNRHPKQIYPGPCSGDAEPRHYMSKADCVVKTGIDYAQACEAAKKSKADPNKQRAWNEAIPTFESCKNSRRR